MTVEWLYVEVVIVADQPPVNLESLPIACENRHIN